MKNPVQYSFQRYEKKYFLTPEQQTRLLPALRQHMQADAYGQYTLCNTYYDTADWRLIRASLEKPVYKEKLRVRSYGVPEKDGRVFIEIKKKFDGIVYKRRITAATAAAAPFLAGCDDGRTYGQIGREIACFRDFYRPQPRVFIGYDRTALAGLEEPGLRITFDTHIRWRTAQPELQAGDGGQPLLPDDRILMEVKIPGVCPLWLSRLLSENRLFPISFSKYGTCYREAILPAERQTFQEVLYSA